MSFSGDKDMRKQPPVVPGKVFIGRQEEFLYAEGGQALEGAAQGVVASPSLGSIQETCGCGTKRHGLVVRFSRSR